MASLPGATGDGGTGDGGMCILREGQRKHPFFLYVSFLHAFLVKALSSLSLTEFREVLLLICSDNVQESVFLENPESDSQRHFRI